MRHEETRRAAGFQLNVRIVSCFCARLTSERPRVVTQLRSPKSNNTCHASHCVAVWKISDGWVPREHTPRRRGARRHHVARDRAGRDGGGASGVPGASRVRDGSGVVPSVAPGVGRALRRGARASPDLVRGRARAGDASVPPRGRAVHHRQHGRRLRGVLRRAGGARGARARARRAVHAVPPRFRRGWRKSPAHGGCVLSPVPALGRRRGRARMRRARSRQGRAAVDMPDDAFGAAASSFADSLGGPLGDGTLSQSRDGRIRVAEDGGWRADQHHPARRRIGG